jgi:monoamine oxidase
VNVHISSLFSIRPSMSAQNGRVQLQKVAPSAPMLDALIIGAGAAGVGAAALLRGGGLSNFAVLEATDRIGGRVQALPFGSGPQIMIENGANWISGAPRGDQGQVNPVFKLANDMGLQLVRVPGSATNMSNWDAYDEFGNSADLDGKRRTLANNVTTCISKGVDSGRFSNTSAVDAASECGWAPNPDGLDSAIEWQLFTGESGLPVNKMRAENYLPDPTYGDFGADDFFFKNQDPLGYSTVIHAVADGALDGGAKALDEGRLVLGAEVDRIELECDYVTVRSKDGRSWRSLHVISTLPLGVLQRRPEIFTPPMLTGQREALGRISMSNYTKIHAQWDEVWWNASVYKWVQANDGFNGGTLPSVRNLAHASVLPSSRTLLFDLGDPQASEWEQLDDDAAKAKLVAELQRVHPGKAIPLPSAFHMTRHSIDPLSYGAYSDWGDSTAEDHLRAGMPLSAPTPPASGQFPPRACPPRVWLSGEALCPRYNGFVHGGLISGRRDATRVLAALGVNGSFAANDGCDMTLGRDQMKRGRAVLRWRASFAR